MADFPLFQDISEFRMWKHIRGSSTMLEPRDSKGLPKKTMASVTESESSLHPAVLCALLERMGKVSADGDTLASVVSKSRNQDSSPSVAAAMIALHAGDTDLAGELLDMSAGSTDTLHRSLAAAEIYLAESRTEEARAAAEDVYGRDPGCRRAYQILADTDPEGGWQQKSNIMDILDGKVPESPAGVGKYQELYGIYYDWFRGRRESASEKLAGSVHYASRDRDFLLASARFSADERDWHSSKMVYDGILEGAPPYVVVEAASVYLSGGEPSHALKLLEGTDRSLRPVMMLTIRCCLQLGRRREAMEAVRMMMDDEYTTLTDFLEVVRMLMDRGMAEEADSLVTRISKVYPGDSSILSLTSMVRMERGDIPGAMAAARSAVRADRNDHSARIQMARMLLEADKPDMAAKECNRVLAKNPKDRDAMSVLKDVAFHIKDDRAALDMCTRILDEYPDDVPSMKAKALALGRLGDSEGARDMLRKALDTDPGRDESIDIIGMMIDHDMYREAVYACLDLEKNYPRDPMVKRLKGNAEYCSGDYLKASVSFASAAELTPCDPVVWHSKGMADEARGDLRSAEDAYNRATVLDMDEARYWISKSVIQEKLGNYSGAVESLNRAIQQDTRSVYALVRKAKIFADTGRYDEAVYYMRMADAVSPGDRDILYELMRIQMSAGDYASAVSVGERIVSGREDRAVSSALAECYGKLGMPEKAAPLPDDPEPEPVPRPEDGRRQSGDDPDALAAIAASLLSAGDIQGAARMIDSAWMQEPGNPRYTCIKARVSAAQGDTSGAEAMAVSALRTHPGDPDLLELLGDLRSASGDSEAAVEVYRRAVSFKPSVGRYVKLGKACEASGDTDGAVEAYERMADSPEAPADAVRSLASMLMAKGLAERAERWATRLVDLDPADASSWVLKAEVCMQLSDRQGVLDAFSGFQGCSKPSREDRDRMVKVMEGTGNTAEAAELRGESTPESRIDTAVKRYAEKAMRRAVTTRSELDDPDLVAALGLEPVMEARVSEYLSDIPDYGEIVPGSDVFRRMERLSRDIVMKLSWTDLENQPALPLHRVFVSGGFRDADDAKQLTAYVNAAMIREVGRVSDERLNSMSMGLPRGMTVYEVMSECGVGVYEARMILAQVV